MRRVSGICTNKVFDVPNIVRGLAGGREGISLPFSVTVTQIVIIFIFFLISLPLSIVMTPFIPNQVARFIIVCIAAPSIFGYLLGSQTKENMNILRYGKIKVQTFLEPKEIIRFEEVEPAKNIRFKQKIRIQKRHY